MDDYDATAAGRAIQAFVDDLSNWYVRRSRRRFWDGDPAAFATLHHCLVSVVQLLAPFTPFIADEIYRNLDPDGEVSVHLCDYPDTDRARLRDVALEDAMEVAREAVRLGLAARGQSKIKLRQPLHAAAIVATGREREAIERLADIVREELNVKELRFVSAADELGELEVKPNYRALGPRFGKQMPLVADAVAGLDPTHVAAALRDGRTVGVMIDGHDHELGAEDLQIAMQPLEGYQLEREGSHAVALELALDDELRREGLAREVVHAVQAARKAAGLDVSDRIALDARRRRGAARRRARARALRHRRNANDGDRLRRATATATPPPTPSRSRASHSASRSRAPDPTACRAASPGDEVIRPVAPSSSGGRDQREGVVPGAASLADRDPQDHSDSSSRERSMPPTSNASQPKSARIAATVRLRVGVVAGDEHRLAAAGQPWVDHQRVVDGVEGLHDACAGDRALDRLAAGVGVADGERRAAAGEVERVRHVDDELAGEVLRAGGGDRLLDGGASRRQHHDLAGLGGGGEGADGDVVVLRGPRLQLVAGVSPEPRVPIVTSCPCAAKPAASARPTAPLPMTPTRVGSMALVSCAMP